MTPNSPNITSKVKKSFGSPMIGRGYEADTLNGYRFGMNTQEKDDEIYGKGNASSAEFWEYDTRLGRRWNLDPKPQISISDYSCFGNNPILYVDILGDTKESKHLDPDGKLIAEYNDGDASTYKHQTARTKGAVDKWREKFNNTSGNGVMVYNPIINFGAKPQANPAPSKIKKGSSLTQKVVESTVAVLAIGADFVEEGFKIESTRILRYGQREANGIVTSATELTKANGAYFKAAKTYAGWAGISLDVISSIFTENEFQNGNISARERNLSHLQNASTILAPPVVSVAAGVGSKIGETYPDETLTFGLTLYRPILKLFGMDKSVDFLLDDIKKQPYKKN